ncbi:hypothetical protein MNV49_006567 [Pseudohyphozyma bogoriensis]|nr:hypothetical protein MNV49_006567 [Pseudohyphozyma bogoriensis]
MAYRQPREGTPKQRNGFVYNDRGTLLAGFLQLGTLSAVQYYRCLRMNLQTSDQEWRLYSCTEAGGVGRVVEEDETLLPEGNYMILGADGAPLDPEVQVTEEKGRFRVPTVYSTPTEWTTLGYDLLVTDEHPSVGPHRLDSIQNTILLRADLHYQFASYGWGVDPRSGYKITSFTTDANEIDGKELWLRHIPIDSPDRPLDVLFEDHYRQCVLKHMRGAGSEIMSNWDSQMGLGGGTSLNDEIWEGEKGKQALEYLLADKLGSAGDN